MANVSNTYYQTYDANGAAGDFDDHDRYLGRTTTGNSILKELTKGDPFKGVVKLVNTAKQFNLKSELTDLLIGSTTVPLDKIVGRTANTDNFKFQYGINDKMIDPSKKFYQNYVDKIEDPTILTFTCEIDEVNSPLYQRDIVDFIQVRKPEFLAAGEVSLEGQNFNIISSNIGGLYDEMEVLLSEFRLKLREIFTSYQTKNDNSVYSKSYYITSMSGINELDKVWTGTGEGDKFEFSKLKVTMREDVKLTARNLYFLYNTLKMHRRSGKRLIPENLLRFNMWIKISEIRNFTSLRFAVETGANQDIIDAIKRDVTAIYYYVQDCTFDFSKLHRDTYSVEDEKQYENLEFEIQFRRAFRVFKPTLMKSEEISENGYYGIDERTAKANIANKQYSLPNFIGLNTADTSSVRPSLMPELNTFVRQQDPVHGATKETASSKKPYSPPLNNANGATTTQKLFQSLGKFMSTGQVNLNPNNRGGLVGKALNLASQAVTRLAQSAKNTVIEKRNQLVRDLENKVKNQVGFGVPRPKNIYKPGDGSGVIGNTLESLSKATGIDFLAIREGRNIQSFSNTDVQKLNPSLQGRDILSGPGGDYSQINPNSVNENEEIGDVTPDANFTMIPPDTDLDQTTNYNRGKIVSQAKHNLYQEISGLSAFGAAVNLRNRPKPDDFPNHDLHPASNVQPDLTLLKDLHPDGNNVKDTSVLVNIEGESDFQPDLTLLNNDLHPASNFKPDTSVLNDIVPDGVNLNDTNVLKTNLQQGAAANNDISVLNNDLHPDGDNFKDISVLKDVAPNNVANPNDINVLNVNLQKNTTLTEQVAFKNVYETKPFKQDLSLLDNDLHPEAEQSERPDIEKNVNPAAREVNPTELGKIDTILRQKEFDQEGLGKIDTTGADSKNIELGNVDQ